MKDEGFNKLKRPVPILTRENKDMWFRMMKQRLTYKGLIGQVEDAIPIEDSAKNFGVMYTLNLCISIDDQEDLSETTTAKEMWIALVKKYEQKMPSMSRHYVQQYYTYKKPKDKTIDDAWGEIRELSRKAASLSSENNILCELGQCMQQLLASLGPEYKGVIDTIDNTGDLTDKIEIILLRLREKEHQLKEDNENETGMCAKNRGNNNRQQKSKSYSSRRRGSTSSNESCSKSPKRRCYLCNGPHGLKDCPEKADYDAYKRFKNAAEKEKEAKSKKKQRAYHACDATSTASSVTVAN
ncbi:MAG: hypothetical protein Q9191_004314 [Dirinaria sp. TL-2023a]